MIIYVSKTKCGGHPLNMPVGFWTSLFTCAHENSAPSDVLHFDLVCVGVGANASSPQKSHLNCTAPMHLFVVPPTQLSAAEFMSVHENSDLVQAWKKALHQIKNTPGAALRLCVTVRLMISLKHSCAIRHFLRYEALKFICACDLCEWDSVAASIFA